MSTIVAASAEVLRSEARHSISPLIGWLRLARHQSGERQDSQHGRVPFPISQYVVIVRRLHAFVAATPDHRYLTDAIQGVEDALSVEFERQARVRPLVLDPTDDWVGLGLPALIVLAADAVDTHVATLTALLVDLDRGASQ
jgi:hypothetical protein